MDTQFSKLLELSEKLQIDRQMEMSEEILKADPKISPITAMIIAGDRLSADRSWDLLKQGETFKRASLLVGSYARLDFAVRALEAGYVDEKTIFADLPDLWSGSDPDDTNPIFLQLWRGAWIANGRKYIRDGKPLPRKRILTVYRGQDVDSPFGIAWSLDKDIAAKFARGAATRQANRGGVVYAAQVYRDDVMGYLTDRGESETIIDPKNLFSEWEVG